jgi:circadian clock protein KaiC
VDGACRRGETALYFAFEESPDQILRNMLSVGIDLRPWVEEGLLHIRARRPSEYGLENHLRDADRALQEVDPDVMVLDPFTSLTPIGFRGTTRSMMIRLVDLLKSQNVTAMFTSLAAVDPAEGHSGEKVISSLMDAWVVLEAQRRRGRRRRFIWILKSRGMEHSPEIHEVVVEDGRVAVSGPVDSPGGGPS